MDSLSSIFGLGGGLVGILLIVLLLIVIGLLVYRMVGQQNFGSGRRNKQARLAVTDAITFSKKHKLVLLRRDDIEHLVLIGGPTDIVVESNIRRNTAVRPRENLNNEAEPRGTAASAPAPAKEPVETEPKAETTSPPKLRPVANEPPPKPARPQFVPRQEPAGAPKPAAEQRAATAVATPHVRPAAQKQESPFAGRPEPRAAPPPPSSSPPTDPKVVGGLVATPLAASAGSTGKTTTEQESPFKDDSPAQPERLAVVQKPLHDETTAPPSKPVEQTPTDSKPESSGSVADDMDALLKELSAKR